MSPSCSVSEHTIDRNYRAVTLENDLLAITVLPEKGADIYRWIYKPRRVDVLWKSPWGLKHPGSGVSTAGTTEEAWLEHYEGGWQEIFPKRRRRLRLQGMSPQLSWRSFRSPVGLFDHAGSPERQCRVHCRDVSQSLYLASQADSGSNAGLSCRSTKSYSTVAKKKCTSCGAIIPPMALRSSTATVTFSFPALSFRLMMWKSHLSPGSPRGQWHNGRRFPGKSGIVDLGPRTSEQRTPLRVWVSARSCRQAGTQSRVALTTSAPD